MTGRQAFEIVLVLGPGRSGTSVVTQILNRCGVALAGELVPANDANPEGHWEDREVVRVHRELLAAFGRDDLIGAATPLDEGWLRHPAAAAAKAKLRAHLEAVRSSQQGPWGVKDPRLCQLLPLWQQLARELEAPLRCVLCLRHPASVANSMQSAYELDPAIGEAVWLNRVACALECLDGEFCVVHYEDLLANAAQVLRGLLEFVHVRPAVIEGQLARLLGDGAPVRPELNRAAREQEPSNPLVAEMYAELRKSAGPVVVGAVLKLLVARYRRACREYAGWRKCIEVAPFRDSRAPAGAAASGAAPRAELARLEAKLRKAERQARTLRRDLRRVQESRAFRLSRYLGEARRSWLRLPALPYRIWRLLFGPGQHEQALREKLLRQSELTDEARLKLRQASARVRELRQKTAKLEGRRKDLGAKVGALRDESRRNSAALQDSRQKLATLEQRRKELGESVTALREELRVKTGELGRTVRRLKAKLSNAAMETAALAWSLKRVMLDAHADRLGSAAPADVAVEFPLAAAPRAGAAAAAQVTAPRRILYVGPVTFQEGIWDTRAKYILPDLFDALVPGADIHMLTAPVPAFARPALDSLCARYGIGRREVSGDEYVGDATELWLAEALQAAHELRPDVVTNIFGVGGTGFVVGMVGRLLSCRSVLRIAGDDIGVRTLLGAYDGRPDRLARDRLHQALSFAMADRIITMSPWEQQRVRSLVADAGKVVVCMRGVDLRRFAPRDGAGRPCRRFLYVGRKSFEKGYDLMEEAASIVGAKQPAVEFVFAGNFNVGESGNRKYVGFVQPEDLPALYASVDAVILPSRSEGFPQVLAEAMAMGKPCIVPEAPFGAMFRHEHDVLLTQTGGESLAHAVLRLHADPALCRKLAEASLRFARAELDRDRWRAAYRSNILGAA